MLKNMLVRSKFRSFQAFCLGQAGLCLPHRFDISCVGRFAANVSAGYIIFTLVQKRSQENDRVEATFNEVPNENPLCILNQFLIIYFYADLFILFHAHECLVGASRYTIASPPAGSH
jgi:hypothetical protein